MYLDAFSSSYTIIVFGSERSLRSAKVFSLSVGQSVIPHFAPKTQEPPKNPPSTPQAPPKHPQAKELKR